jgi:hypothetical protein
VKRRPETSLRMTVECIDGRCSSFAYDVGPAELEALLLRHAIVRVVHWGRYAGWASGSAEHQDILRALEGRT